MRQNQQNNKRMRGRNRKGPNPLTRTYESNGPDVKIRGTALHIAEKYTQLARDASSSGDRVMAENYLQHAEHYYRVIATAQAALQPSQAFGRDDFVDEDGDDLEPLGSDRFEPRQIDFRPQNGPYEHRNGEHRGDRPEGRDFRAERPDHREARGGEREDRPERENGVGREPYAPRERGEGYPPRDRGEGYPPREGGDRRERRQRFERFDRRGERPDRGEPRPERGERPDRGEPRPDRAERPERRGDFRGERVPTGPAPMPLDAPQPDVSFPDLARPATPPAPPAPALAPVAEPPVAALGTAPVAPEPAAADVADAGDKRPARRRAPARPRTRRTAGGAEGSGETAGE